MSSHDNVSWFGEDLVLALHEALLAEHGGKSGVRDRGLLESALARPQNAAAYSAADVPTLGAIYALGVIKNHPFIDGNKRVGAVLLELFLEDHGYVLEADDAELVVTIFSVASGDLSDDGFISWVRNRAHPE